MYSPDTVSTDLETATRDLLQFLSVIDESRLYQDVDGSWSAGAHLEHIIKLETAVAKALPAAHPSSRPADMKIVPVRDGLANLEQKFVAPDFILPSGVPIARPELMEKLSGKRKELQRMIASLDLTETVEYKHPVIGSMTRLEWMYFLIHHGQRHLRQMQKMAK